ncbi:MAG: transcription-repair coupling factor, partial [Firmicutes bacterium]|nr:transcription-repair coupling factor [Bacillota bacterium]
MSHFPTISYAKKTKEFLQKARDKNISAFGLRLGERAVFAAELKKSTRGTIVYICADDESANRAYTQLNSLTPSVVYLRPKHGVLYYRQFLVQENFEMRLNAMAEVCKNPDCILVTTLDAVLQLFPHREDFSLHCKTFAAGDSCDTQSLTEFLISAGYTREGVAGLSGQFSLRGDLLDIFPPFSPHGIRLEFFGDTIESIKSYSPADLRSGEMLPHAAIIPNTEIFYENAGEILEKVKTDFSIPKDSEALENHYKLLSILSTDLTTNSKSMRLSFLMPFLPHATFAEFFNPSIVLYDDAKQVANLLDSLYTEHENSFKAGLKNGELLNSSFLQFVKKDTALAFLSPQTAFHAFDSQNRIFAPQALFQFKSLSVPIYHRNLEALADDVSGWLSNDFRVVLCCGSKQVRDNVHDFLLNQHSFVTDGKGKLEILETHLPESVVLFEEKTIAIGTSNIARGGAKKRVLKRSKKDIFSVPEVGSFVVHQYHGVGFCEAVTQMEVLGAKRDYVLIRYANNDALYVPVENMDSLTAYGETEIQPKLSKLGGAEFARVKERVKESVEKMAMDLAALYAERSQLKGHEYTGNRELYDAFVMDFPFDETDDQLTSTEEVLQDLTQGKIMDRLLCGDVGYGKTEVALRGAFEVITEGKQVALLCPTTILAHQHFKTAKKRMESFGIKVAALTRFESAASVKATLEGLKSGTVDMVCGTHRLLSKDVEFKDLGLLILDEEQRFGVGDKEKIKALKKDINVLTLTATPIPRTLHLSLSGIRDISVLDTPPQERLAVQTTVAEYNEDMVKNAILREKGRGGQAFVVYNRVQSIDVFASALQKLVGQEVSIAVAHGKMTGEKLEDTIAKFTNGEFDVLVSSTIIENGIDMPNANTLIVIDSDRFGLAQLYQLRGRVGRSHKLAHAYFTFDGKKLLTDAAAKRLEAIGQFTEFGSGFKIAMRDLEIRGAGNLLGREQHGHVERVGYDMYCKILAETVAEAQGQQSNLMNPDLRVITDYDTFIPSEYLDNEGQRVRVYTRISQIAN